MSEPRESSQEQEVNIVEKFREILYRKPERSISLGERDEDEIEELKEDVIFVYYKDRSILLEQEEKIIRGGIYLGMSHTKFGRSSESISHPVEKTTVEQLRDIVEKNGYPTEIYYGRHEINNVEDEKKIFGDTFSFSKIKEDLGL